MESATWLRITIPATALQRVKGESIPARFIKNHAMQEYGGNDDTALRIPNFSTT
jgi:hypothetical protein